MDIDNAHRIYIVSFFVYFKNSWILWGKSIN